MDGHFSLKISIPANTTATVWVRCGPDEKLFENDTLVGSAVYTNGYAVAEVGSGVYRFQSKDQ